MKNIYLSYFGKNTHNRSSKRLCMNKKLKFVYYIVLGISLLGIFSNSIYAHSDGAPSACLGAGIDRFDWTIYAPGRDTCGALGCHYQYPIDSGEGKFKLYVVNKCEPGDIVDILITFEKTDTEFHGFQIAAQDRYYGRLVGTFINVGDDEDTQVESEGLFATHTKKGIKQKFWHVKWQAPPKDFFVANPVRLYAMGVESNNDGTAIGDYIYKATRLLVVERKKGKKEQVRVIKKE